LRRAASLIELLVVVSILACVFALLLPAIQAARESARRLSCQNNLRQVGVALAGFESANDHFPMGGQARFDRRLSPAVMYGLSWWVDVLPHLGEASVSRRLDRTGANTGWAYLNSNNGEVADGFGPEYWFCPASSVARFVRSGDYRIAAPSYTGLSGATSHDDFPEIRVNRCCRSEGEISAGGVLIPNAVIRVGEVSDGLSKTIVVGEQSEYAYTDSGEPVQIGSSFVKGWLAGTVGLGTPPNYLDWLAPSYNLASLRYGLNERRYDLPGVYYDIGANNPLLSPHPGIVNMLFCDGSVHGVDDSAEVLVLKSQVTRDDGMMFGP
jgi:prepilin-type processing-associated H-X9-DG protein